MVPHFLRTALLLVVECIHLLINSLTPPSVFTLLYYFILFYYFLLVGD